MCYRSSPIAGGGRQPITQRAPWRYAAAWDRDSPLTSQLRNKTTRSSATSRRDRGQAGPAGLPPRLRTAALLRLLRKETPGRPMAARASQEIYMRDEYSQGIQRQREALHDRYIGGIRAPD